MSGIESAIKRLHRNINIVVKFIPKIPTLTREQQKVIVDVFKDMKMITGEFVKELRILKGGRL